MTRICVYFVTWDYASSIELELYEGERIVGVTQGGSYRNVWIEGTKETRDKRFPKRKEDQ